MKFVPPRVASALRYLSVYASPPGRWRAGWGQCPLCGHVPFLALGPSPFLTRCLRCSANVTNLSLVPIIERHFEGRYTDKVAYELSSFGSTLKWLRRHFQRVEASEYFPHLARGSLAGGIRNEDVQCLTYPDASFDLVTSNQVFEHVPDDIAGYRECLRVLKPGGALVFSVPLRDLAQTEPKARLLPGGSIEIIGEPEYHDSRLGGPGSALCFWHHSLRDMAQRVGQVGFAAVSLEPVTLAKVQHLPEWVIYAKRSL
jgi:SAM-dependent methyltransferase